MHRFFVEGVRELGDEVALAQDDARKARVVLRLRDGDRVEIADSGSQAFVASVAIRGDAVVATLAEAIPDARGETLRVDVAQAVPKGSKMDFVVEKLTELGVARILPFVSERCVARDAGAPRVERWRRLARAAALQCGRREIPEVAQPSGFDELLARFAGYDLILFAWELAPDRPLRETLPALLAGATRVLAVVGPEGGFSHDEAERAQAAGARQVRLGRRILRTETAALALVAVLEYASEGAALGSVPELGTSAS
jgi:16S rRNA (uracil1498-N3)-methyltransferase